MTKSIYDVCKSLEILQDRSKKLEKLKLQNEVNLQHLDKNLDELNREALESFGTSDIKKLEKILENIEEENESMVKEYENHLEEIEGQLRALEDEE